ncbi:hypothetical protein AMS58_08180 [Pseudoalteromonas porphyrae]|uniref:hypothetical protein n=1 Tax=Pseudoalteromonas TaxID=53246 RepID=UPI0006BAC113|nr:MULTISPECIES: hypothetical protein [Pseudoalteromonas]KPH95318.1 hypothetical protein AMS58_08180 [Pseudoalteromonas porphyrae]
MNRTDKQAISMLTIFATLMLASIVLPSQAATVDATTVNASSEVLTRLPAAQQCLIGSDIFLQ